MTQGSASRIDDQWAAEKPSTWGKGKHKSERKMLHNILEWDEVIKALATGTLIDESVSGSLQGEHRGIVVATTKRVLFVKSRVVGGDFEFQLPYRSLVKIAETTGSNVAEGVHIHRAATGDWRIVRVGPQRSEDQFAQVVAEQAEARSGQTPRVGSSTKWFRPDGET